MKGTGRRIVVDADVGRAAANLRRAERGEPMDERALAFAQVLQAFYDARNVAVFSPALAKEWRKHARGGSAGHRWLLRLVERRLVIQLDTEPDGGELDDAIAEELSVGDQAVAKKDRHLVATALTAADKRLLSGDGKAREKYVRLVPQVPALGDLHWVDPGWDGVRTWLLERAPDHLAWTLAGDAA